MHQALTWAFWTFLAVTSVVCFVIALLIWTLTLPFDPQRKLNHWFSCLWAQLYFSWYPGWKGKWLHRERIERNRPYILVANHTSIADIVLCFLLYRQFKWVSKASMFNAPFMGWNMRLCRYIPLRRGDAASIQAMLESCRRWLARGMPVMMFPEGTRSRDGQLRPFKHGAFSLAIETGVPVVPVVIRGGHALIPKGTRSVSARAELVVEVLPPISPVGLTDAGAFAQQVRGIFAEALGQ